MSKNLHNDIFDISFCKYDTSNAKAYAAQITITVPNRRLRTQKRGMETITKNSQNDLIDVNDFIKEHTVEELCSTAEEYFKRFENWDQLHAKPFTNSNDVQHLLVNFSHLINGFQLYRGIKILVFGAGSCWASRFLNQMGYSVVSLDTSKTALQMGEDLKRKHPVFGQQPAHAFLHFDGRKIDLPDESIDRIFCLDAFHHIPNQEEVLGEMSRILKQGGIAGFAEAGPDHSKHPQSQFEMKNFKVLENDIVLKDIYEKSLKVGFTDLRVSISGIYPYLVNLDKFDNFLNDTALQRQYRLGVDNRMRSYPIFFLDKGNIEVNDSRNMSGLVADIKSKSRNISKKLQPFSIDASFKNTSNKIGCPPVIIKAQ
jgi:SAM-dependent methyltransferase